MARRNILTGDEPRLRKKCREVTAFDARLHQLLDDMRETLLESGGVGLAAPQVGILRRAVLVIETNVEEGEEEYIIELINPQIVSASGEQRGSEGCLSVPGRQGHVTRAAKIRVRAQDRNGQPFEEEADGLYARCIQHEIDHLDGVLYVDKMTEEVFDDGEQ